MHQLLPLGTTVQSASGHPCTVETFLGGGGQGEVYRANLVDRVLALKWYFPEQATPAQRNSLELLIRKGPPSAPFLWPLELASADDFPDFGYLMPLREPHYKGLVDLMKRRTEPTFRTLATAGMQLAQAFLDLHTQGLCYRDISFGNVFFDPETGAIQVCDNDNVAIDRAVDSGVLGTPRFIAPEVVRGEAAPSTQTDLFSLSVLLFYLLHIHHPLEGRREAEIKCFDLPAMNRLYGDEPLFIFDPHDEGNRPVPGLHDNALAYWPLYPQSLRDLFTRAFTAGLHDPEERVRESEWRAALGQLRDTIRHCEHCGAENFHDVGRPADEPFACWHCDQGLAPPLRLRLGREQVVLNRDTELFPHHLDRLRRYDFGAPLASVQPHPQHPQIWGLNNRSATTWVITTAEGTTRDVEPGRSLTLAAGVKIRFGNLEGEIHR
jgi:DNA-binding helix-hairpin-helix protein with protein kinase domain